MNDTDKPKTEDSDQLAYLRRIAAGTKRDPNLIERRPNVRGQGQTKTKALEKAKARTRSKAADRSDSDT